MGSVIDAATILVEVSSGADSNPYNVFSQILDVDETKVTFQVRAGLPGVIYKLICGVRVSGDWTYFCRDHFIHLCICDAALQHASHYIGL